MSNDLVSQQQDEDSPLFDGNPGIAFSMLGIDVERTAQRLVQQGVAMQVVDAIFALYGFQGVRSEDVEFQIDITRQGGPIFFRQFWKLEDDGTVTEIGRPVQDFPGWYVAHLESQRQDKPSAICYVCEQPFKEGEELKSKHNGVTGRTDWMHAEDCSL